MEAPDACRDERRTAYVRAPPVAKPAPGVRRRTPGGSGRPGPGPGALRALARRRRRCGQLGERLAVRLGLARLTRPVDDRPAHDAARVDDEGPLVGEAALLVEHAVAP